MLFTFGLAGSHLAWVLCIVGFVALQLFPVPCLFLAWLSYMQHESYFIVARVLFIFGLGGLQLVRDLFIGGVVALHLRLTWLVYMLIRPCWILVWLSTISLIFFFFNLW